MVSIFPNTTLSSLARTDPTYSFNNVTYTTAGTGYISGATTLTPLNPSITFPTTSWDFGITTQPSGASMFTPSVQETVGGFRAILRSTSTTRVIWEGTEIFPYEKKVKKGTVTLLGKDEALKAAKKRLEKLEEDTVALSEVLQEKAVEIKPVK